MLGAQVSVRVGLDPVEAAQDQALEAGLAALAGDQPVLEPLLDLPGVEAGDVTDRVRDGEVPDLFGRLEAVLAVQLLGQQRMQGGPEQQQRPDHDRRREQHHPGPQVEPGEAEAAQSYP